MSKDWTQASDEALLKVRICDLKLKIEGSAIAPWIQTVLEQLKTKNVPIIPKIYLGDEWFSPEGCMSISVPFYLAHPRLIELEKKMMLEAEGADREYFYKLLRHECGHTIDHAYRFSKRRLWKQHFGNPEQEYQPELYRPRPFSRSFVKHLDNWYAQSHPDEDFAETFAVWLNPELNWREVYDDWTIALKKLKYVNSLMREVRRKAPVHVEYEQSYSASKMKATLHTYYQRKMAERAEDYPSLFDEELWSLFGKGTGGKNSAAVFLKKQKKALVDAIAYWTGEKKYTVDSLIQRLILRCEELGLVLPSSGASDRMMLQISSFLTAAVNRHLFTGKFKRNV